MSDKLLTLKLTDTSLKDKQASHLRLKNVDNLKLPQMNKPVWDNLSQFTCIKESKLQNVQKDVLSSAVPVIKVMETLADAKDDLSVLDAKSIINTLKDALIFVGSADMNIIKVRRDNVKPDLPKQMQGLCTDTIEHSSDYLFGNNSMLPLRMCLNLIRYHLPFGTNFSPLEVVEGVSLDFEGGLFAVVVLEAFTDGSLPIHRGKLRKSLNQAGPSLK